MLKNHWRFLTGWDAQSEQSIAFNVIGDKTTRVIQSRISLEQFGNEMRKARKGQQRVKFGYFGLASTEAALLGADAVEARAAKRKQLMLDNVLGLGRLPRPSGAR